GKCTFHQPLLSRPKCPNNTEIKLLMPRVPESFLADEAVVRASAWNSLVRIALFRCDRPPHQPSPVTWPVVSDAVGSNADCVRIFLCANRHRNGAPCVAFYRRQLANPENTIQQGVRHELGSH